MTYKNISKISIAYERLVMQNVTKRWYLWKKDRNNVREKEKGTLHESLFLITTTISKKEAPSQTLRSDLRKLFFHG